MSVRKSVSGAAAAALIAGAAALGSADSAQADQHALWCADLGELTGGNPECAYYTYEQCKARASGITNICSINPYYVPERPPVRRLRREPQRYR